jgi:Uma2 family endonuclease
MAAPAKTRPELHSGDRLTRYEFHRRYADHPEIKKAELIEGVVYVASPVSMKHAQPHKRVMFWLATYERLHPDAEAVDNGTVLLDVDNEVQPDAFLRRVEGGTSSINEKHYIEGPPELVVEIAVSSVSIDLHSKMDAYRRNGVREYVVWRVEDEAIDWFQLVDGSYQRTEPADGRYASTQFEGLVLDVAAILAGDLDGVARAIER